MDCTDKVIGEITGREDDDVCAYVCAVLRQRGEVRIRHGRVILTVDSAYASVITDLVGKIRTLTDGETESGRRGDGESLRYYVMLEDKQARELMDKVRTSLMPGIEETRYYLKNRQALTSYVRGLFAGGGTLTTPSAGERGYYLEIRMQDAEQAEAVRSALAGYGVNMDVSERRIDSLLYTRKGEEICNLLAFAGAQDCAMDVHVVIINRNITSSVNRRANYEASNIDKVLAKAALQAGAIEYLRSLPSPPETDAETEAIWTARTENKMESAAWLAARLGMSKSKVFRRLEKAIETAKEKGWEIEQWKK